MHGDNSTRLQRIFEAQIGRADLRRRLILEVTLRRRAGSGILQILLAHGKHVFSWVETL